MLGRTLGLVGLLAFAAPAGAVTLDYSSFHVLGDSLSDVGNVYRGSRGLLPASPPYWRGRFSNGPLWSDLVARKFRRQSLPTSIEAWAGAKARSDGIGVPDLGMQALRYAALDEDRRGDRPLVAIWAGSNDLIDAVNAPRIAAVGRRGARAVGTTARGLALTGVEDFLIFNLPDLGRVPRYARRAGSGDAAAETRGARAFNRALDRQLDALRDDGLTVTEVDMHRLLDRVFAKPRAYGLANVTTPCLDARDNPCTPRQARRRAFFDNLHPNYVFHRRIAEAALAALGTRAAAAAAAPVAAPIAPAPVPLPPAAGLLLGAVAALGLCRGGRRRRS
jgi:outer membrane lipase/esterase